MDASSSERMNFMLSLQAIVAAESRCNLLTVFGRFSAADVPLFPNVFKSFSCSLIVH
jgi:hypothetical protein